MVWPRHQENFVCVLIRAALKPAVATAGIDCATVLEATAVDDVDWALARAAKADATRAVEKYMSFAFV